MYSDTDLSCQEESDVRDKKNEICDTGGWKIKMRGDICEDYCPNSAQYGATIAKATTGLRAASAAGSSENSRCGVGGWVIPAPGMPIIGKNAELGRCI
jgi:hypothetical protein